MVTVWPKWLIEETIARYDQEGDQHLNKEEWARAFAVLSMPADKRQRKKDRASERQEARKQVAAAKYQASQQARAVSDDL